MYIDMYITTGYTEEEWHNTNAVKRMQVKEYVRQIKTALEKTNILAASRQQGKETSGATKQFQGNYVIKVWTLRVDLIKEITGLDRD